MNASRRETLIQANRPWRNLELGEILHYKDLIYFLVRATTAPP